MPSAASALRSAVRAVARARLYLVAGAGEIGTRIGEGLQRGWIEAGVGRPGGVEFGRHQLPAAADPGIGPQPLQRSANDLEAVALRHRHIDRRWIAPPFDVGESRQQRQCTEPARGQVGRTRRHRHAAADSLQIAGGRIISRQHRDPRRARLTRGQCGKAAQRGFERKLHPARRGGCRGCGEVNQRIGGGDEVIGNEVRVGQTRACGLGYVRRAIAAEDGAAIERLRDDHDRDRTGENRDTTGQGVAHQDAGIARRRPGETHLAWIASGTDGSGRRCKRQQAPRDIGRSAARGIGLGPIDGNRDRLVGQGDLAAVQIMLRIVGSGDDQLQALSRRNHQPQQRCADIGHIVDAGFEGQGTQDTEVQAGR